MFPFEMKIVIVLTIVSLAYTFGKALLPRGTKHERCLRHIKELEDELGIGRQAELDRLEKEVFIQRFLYAEENLTTAMNRDSVTVTDVNTKEG